MQSLFCFHTSHNGFSRPRKIWKFSSLENTADNCKDAACLILLQLLFISISRCFSNINWLDEGHALNTASWNREPKCPRAQGSVTRLGLPAPLAVGFLWGDRTMQTSSPSSSISFPSLNLLRVGRQVWEFGHEGNRTDEKPLSLLQPLSNVPTAPDVRHAVPPHITLRPFCNKMGLGSSFS